MADLARNLVQEPVFRRSVLGKIQEYHLAMGGAPTETDIRTLIKKAVLILARTGLLEPAGKPGWWRWRAGANIPAEQQFGAGVLAAGEFEVAPQGASEGRGSGCIYVYYFPTYKELAVRKQEARWPVKVGMTATGNSCIRVFNQQGTAMPEAPVVAYVRRTDTPRRLEQGLHAILHCRGQQLVDAPGAEWFLSSPDEIKKIVDWVLVPYSGADTT
ncbi:GIY-YIG nuclease family protein [Arthrobacter crusticola]|uniref:GIY-YIG nuclease family protein n=1 Tax=Arthrobacter crusticola TaxID=2547960 RepID=A0A4R5TMA6_9MICC|nr:GIY-YIG nuclease family protein [Arthrobacter crusticola]TDK23509.1 GIY-YIG nuclease family protein [Arthrobacter crusticola]